LRLEFREHDALALNRDWGKLDSNYDFYESSGRFIEMRSNYC